jgi:DNA-binding transcriptional MerR regulator
MTDVSVRTLRNYVTQGLLTPTEFRGTATRYQRRERVLELTMLLEVKRRAVRPKDLAVLPFLDATIAEIAKQG